MGNFDRIKFEDYSDDVKKEIRNQALLFLEESTGSLEGMTKRNSRVGLTSETKGSYNHTVDSQKLIGYVGSNLENAIWEEYGTGEHALNHDGRKGGWWIRVGMGQGQISPNIVNKYGWEKVMRDDDDSIIAVYTHGKKPQRPMFHAYNSLKNPIKKRAEEIFGKIGK